MNKAKDVLVNTKDLTHEPLEQEPIRVLAYSNARPRACLTWPQQFFSRDLICQVRPGGLKRITL